MNKVEFFYDLSSPWTFLAFHNIQPIIAENNAEIRWRPFLVGGVFNAINSEVYQQRENMDSPKMRHGWRWLKEWATLADLPMNFPSEFHPLKGVLAMRVCCCLEDEQNALFRFSSAAFQAYFAYAKNLDDGAILIDVANECGLNGEQLIQDASQQVIKDKLRANTEEAVTRGAFGSPSLFVNKDNMYFGNDQLPLVKQALEKGSKK